MRIYFSLLLSTLYCFAQSQMILQGPVFGAVTDSSARMYLRAGTHAVYQVELALSPAFPDPMLFTATSRDALDHSAILDLRGLSPNTVYYYRIRVNGKQDSIQAAFRTFPKTGDRGDYTFVTGSCQETPNMKVFDVMPTYDPYFLLHTGDYTYPDYQIRRGYAADYPTVAYSYQKRYDEKVMKQMLYRIPIDYIYDDDDYVGPGAGKYVTNDNRQYSMLGFDNYSDFFQDTFPPQQRRNCIKGYTEFFPGYPMVDTTVGIFHSFCFGNAEFFFLDRCSNTPHYNGHAFRKDAKGKWVFDPPADHVLFGKEQMDWLKAGLKSSTADWKFIVSGVPLNRNIRLLIEAGIQHQNLGFKDNTGMRVAAGFANYWAGHPAEMNDFYEFMERENIHDVIVISGDTHHNVMDDGTNSGMPEMNASGLSVSGTELGIAMNLFGKISTAYQFRKEVWNQGGNGIGNYNKKNAFGKVRIVGNEYVEMSIVDEDNKVIASFKVYHSTQPKPTTKKKRSR